MKTGAIFVVAPTPPSDLSRQSVAVAKTYVGMGALSRAVAGGCEWVWLLGAAARPRADALGLLLEAAPEAGVTAGLAVDAGGRLLVEQLPKVTARAPEELVSLAARSLLPIRSTPFANVLVRRDCFDRHGMPDRRYGRWAPVAWSASVLCERVGYLVPASVVELEVEGSDRPGLHDCRAFARMLRTGAWTRGDAVGALIASGGRVRIER
jgi:hypothetical protein